MPVRAALNADTGSPPTHPLSPSTVNNRLAVRCRVSGAFRYRLHDLAAFRAGGRTTLADVARPADLQPGYADTCQGFASYGSHLYLLAGSAYGKDGSVSPDGNTCLTSGDWNTGALVEQRLTKAGYTLLHREPEGMAIQVPGPNTPQAVCLCSGFASETSSTDTHRTYWSDPVTGQYRPVTGGLRPWNPCGAEVRYGSRSARSAVPCR
ncbi:hypothetical protein [Streptomyces sp. NPDC048521]|uniref:hypothetical protein n=1 Tax=Streptomyces sp. NPDC048521 TaxID=3365566 RepID=UPI0037157FE7